MSVRILGVTALVFGFVRPILGQDTGTLVIQGGVTAPLDPSESVRGGVNATIAFVTGRASIGPEAGWYFTAGVDRSPSSRPENTVVLGGVARYDLARGRWRPYFVGGLGLQFWESTRGGYPTENAFDLNAGLGVRQLPVSFPIGLTGEVRVHTSLQSADLDGRTFLTATLGISWRW